MDHFVSAKRDKAFVTFTPALAEKALRRNRNNRKVSSRAVYRLARLMKEGKWADNGESIKFAKDGTLLDGQHRLRAVVEAGVSVKLGVELGLKKEAQGTMDSSVGRGYRTAADHLTMKYGVKNANSTAAALRWLFSDVTIGEANKGNPRYSPSETELADLYPEYPEISEHVTFGANNAFAGLIPRCTVAYVRFVGSKIDKGFSGCFFDAL